MTRRFISTPVLLALFALTLLSGCASDRDTPGPADRSPDNVNRRSRSLDLVAPDASADPSKLSDAELSAAIAQSERRVNEFTADSFRYAAEYSGSDLSGDTKYRALLREMKLAETELGRLEAELAARRKRP